MDEILELHGGRAGIKPLNYDALLMLKNPLYVKMGQTISESISDQNKKLLAELQNANATRALASEAGVPHAQLQEVLETLHNREGYRQSYREEVHTSDEDEDDDPPATEADDADMPDAQDPPPGGGGGGPPTGGTGGGSSSGGGYYGGKPDLEPHIMTDTDAGYSDTDAEGRPRRPPTPPRKQAVDARMQIEQVAVLQDLKNELRKRQMNESTQREVRMGLTQPNPIKEIIREFHQVMAPQPIPAMQQDNSELTRALNEAVAANRDMAKVAHEWGLTIRQMIELMNNQLARPDKQVLPEHMDTSEYQPPGGGGGGYGPIAPKGPRRHDPMTVAETTSRDIYRPGRSASRPPIKQPQDHKIKPPPEGVNPQPKALPAPPKPVPIAVPTPTRPASIRPEPRPESAKPIPAPEPDVVRPESARPEPRPRSASARPRSEPRREPKKIKIRIPAASEIVPSGRDPSLASTVDYGDWTDEKKARSRSRTVEWQEPLDPQFNQPLLPIKEKHRRGRSPTGLARKITEQLARAHSKALVKGQMRMELGRFAAAFAKKRAEPVAPAEPRPASVKPTRTFDEIADMEVPLKNVPFGAGLAKQRTSSEGALRLRYQGRLVR